MNTKRLGNIGEAVVLNEFVKRQIPVYIQFGDTEKADCIAEFNGKLNKIQVKTCEKCSKDKKWFSIKPYSTTTKNGKPVIQKYTKSEVDYFAIYCLELNILVFYPNENVPEQLIFRIVSPKNNQKKGVKMVNDYTLDKILNNPPTPTI